MLSKHPRDEILFGKGFLRRTDVCGTSVLLVANVGLATLFSTTIDLYIYSPAGSTKTDCSPMLPLSVPFVVSVSPLVARESITNDPFRHELSAVVLARITSFCLHRLYVRWKSMGRNC